VVSANQAGTAGADNGSAVCATALPSSSADGCCPAAANANTDADCSASCGNGVVEHGETCDPPSACQPECKTTNACLVMTRLGDPSACNVKCEMTAIAQCKSGDGCCPTGCSYASDTDCSKSCGDGQVTAPETCEPTSTSRPCPASCDDGKACTTDIATGSSAQCNVVCTNTPITAPLPSDGCCPAAGNALNDNDCKPVCGNGVKEGSEICDGADCPTSCDDRDPCTDDKLEGTAAGCTAKCTHTAKGGSAATSDGCCPTGNTNLTDPDCKPVCGNNVKESGELCDGDCRNTCDDANGCTVDTLTGSPQQCNVDCKNATNAALCVGGSCVNTAGSYTCSCGSGYVGSGTQTCTKLRYTTTADTVTDNTMNLVWQRVVPSTYDGCVSGMYCTWVEANAYCSNLVLAGSSDWRSPSIAELQTIVSGTSDPTIDTALFPATPSDFYWSSTSYDADPGVQEAWCINFVSGMSEVKGQGRSYHVRCVH
jgi:hypothetical protein